MGKSDVGKDMESIERYYASLINEADEFSFYLGINDYVAYILSVESIHDVIEDLGAVESQTIKKIESIHKSFTNELSSVEKNIQKIVVGDNLKIEGLDRYIKDLDQINKIIGLENKSFGEELVYKYNILVQILGLLHSNGFEKRIQQYSNISVTGISDYRFSKFYLHYIEAVEALNNNRKVSLWNCWSELMTIYSIASLMEGADSNHEKREVDALTTVTLLNIKHGEKSKGAGKKRIESCVTRIHNHIMEKVFSTKDQNLSKEQRANKVSASTDIRHENIETIEIFKEKLKYRILVNSKHKITSRIKNPDEKERVRYWDYIFAIAENGYAEIDPSLKNGVLGYFNSDPANPIYKKTGLRITKILTYYSDRLDADIPKIKKMKIKQYKEYFLKS